MLVLLYSHRKIQNGFQRSWLILIPFLALNEKKIIDVKDISLYFVILLKLGCEALSLLESQFS